VIYVETRSPWRRAKWSDGLNALVVYEVKPGKWSQQILCPTEIPTVSESHSFISQDDYIDCDGEPVDALKILIGVLTDWGGNGPHFPAQIKTILPVLEEALGEINGI